MPVNISLFLSIFVDIKNQAILLASGGIGDAMESEKLIDFIKANKQIKPITF